MPTYEYLFVNTITKSNWAEIAPLPEASRPAATYTRYAYIWRPGADKGEERELGAAGVLEIYNELGKLGWRALDKTISYSTVYDYTYAGEFYGHKREIGAPVVAEVLFMRELS